jgi:hypothetical protein
MTDARSINSPPANQTPLPQGARRDKSGRLLAHTGGLFWVLLSIPFCS